MFEEETRLLKREMSVEAAKRQRLRDLDCFIMDNSIRESTVGQLRGHTLENKWKIFNEVKKCGFNNFVVASFAHATRVDDEFVQELVKSGEDVSTLYAFTEVSEGVKDGVYDTTKLPVGLTKMQTFGLKNPIIEIDLNDKSVDWSRFTVGDMCKLLFSRMNWSRQFLCSNSKIFINLRDFPLVMEDAPERALEVVSWLAALPPNQRPHGIFFEEPTGKYLPDEVGAWTASIRSVMDKNGWSTGLLLAHVHEKWGFAETAQLECLARGANGVWASVCGEGAAVGHACTSVTLMNLISMGNKKVTERYNCTYLRRAATNVTNIAVAYPPHPRQVVYGERALDFTFDFGNIAGGHTSEGDFNMADFFGEKAPVRISTLSSPAMIKQRLVDLFGNDEQFTDDMAVKMQGVMLEDLLGERKEEYMSEVGIAVLLDRAGGKMTKRMRDVIDKLELNRPNEENLVAEVRKIWDAWDLCDEEQNDGRLEFHSFYNGFMAPYFGCFRCEDTRKGLKAIDMDADGYVEWSEFLVYVKWALREYPDLTNVDQLLSITFRKGIIPAMRDEVVENKTKGKKQFPDLHFNLPACIFLFK